MIDLGKDWRCYIKICLSISLNGQAILSPSSCQFSLVDVKPTLRLFEYRFTRFIYHLLLRCLWRATFALETCFGRLMEHFGNRGILSTAWFRSVKALHRRVLGPSHFLNFLYNLFSVAELF
jgi:hypothetical protein